MNKINNHKLQQLTGQLLDRLNADTRSSSEIARLANVSQPTISRLRSLSGERLRFSKSFSKLCSFYKLPYTEITEEGGGTTEYNELLREAIIDAWDRTEAGGQALLEVIQGLKTLSRRADDTARS
jgi:hypothetical protein